MPAIRAGLKRLTIGGDTYDVAGDGVTYSFGGVQYTEIVGADRYHGVSGKPIAAYVQFAITDSAKLKASGVLDKIGETLVFSLLNGKMFVLADAVNTSERTGDTTDGKINLRFVGSSLTEITV